MVNYAQDKLVVCKEYDENVYFFDRQRKDLITKVKNVSGAKHYAPLELIEGYDFETLPLLIIRDTMGINIINLRSQEIFLLLNLEFCYI